MDKFGIWDAIALAIGLGGLLAGLRNAREVPMPSFISLNRILQSKNHPDVSITFKGTPVENIWCATFGLWNAGKKTILRKDVPPAGRIYVEFKDPVRILRIDAAASESATSAAAQFEDEARLRLEFDYLDERQGILGRILYEGEKTDLEVSGAVIGASSIRTYDWEYRSRKRYRVAGFDLYLSVILATAWLAGLAVAYWYPALLTEAEPLPASVWAALGLYGVLIVFLLLLRWSFFVARKNMSLPDWWQSDEPSGLEWNRVFDISDPPDSAIDDL